MLGGYSDIGFSGAVSCRILLISSVNALFKNIKSDPSLQSANTAPFHCISYYPNPRLPSFFMASTTTTLSTAPAVPLEDLPSYENDSTRKLRPPSNNGDTEARQVQATVYYRFSNLQKQSITAFLALCSFMTSMSTTCILPAIPELMQTFSTTAFVIGISNAVYLAVMGAAALIWGPSADVFGRRAVSVLSLLDQFRSTDRGTQVYRFSLLMFCAASIGTAFSPTLVAFFVFRGLSAIPSTSFLILGSSCISDIYHPVRQQLS